MSFLNALFGNRNDRILKKLRAKVEAINALEPKISALSDAELAAKTVEFKEKLARGATLDDLLIEAFAVVREATKRVNQTRHYDVQLMGGMVLHMGKIPEMRTGEGKTQVALLPVYLNALTGKGVHVVTVNDYLAARDAEWMGRVYRFLGLTVGVIQEHLDPAARREAYACDITYSTNNQLGFDYLRDNMVYTPSEMVQRPFHFAIIDEVDSILIDEARTPLIISGAAEDTTELYVRANEIIINLIKLGNQHNNLTATDFEKVPAKDTNLADVGTAINKGAGIPPSAASPNIFEKSGNPRTQYPVNGYIELDEKTKSALLTDEGSEIVEDMLREAGLLKEGSLYDAQNMLLLHHVSVALRAHKAYKRDKDYIVKDNKIIIIDEFTGRMKDGNRFSDGLHQALEAKEGVTIQRESQTLASITYQNFFRLYPKAAGMTGTAKTEAQEFAEIYNLDVVVMPTHRDIARIDHDDEIYRTEKEKNNAIIKLVKEVHARKQPLLVGTTSIEKSEQLSALFKRNGIPHNVLNARHHEQEAYIISQAGRPGAVTIATNMAGRGTDIKLGGNAEMMLKQQLTGEETAEQGAILEAQINAQVEADKQIVLQAGGLFVIGTERHESRRIDNQLRGRSGRQGDPGASKFFISLQDDLMRIFGAERIDGVMQRLGVQEGMAISSPFISTAIERAQKKVEGQNFDQRRDVLRYDNVMNDQRKVIYDQRRQFMTAESFDDIIDEIIEDVVIGFVEKHIPSDSYKEQWDVAGLKQDLDNVTRAEWPVDVWAQEDGMGEAELTDKILTEIQNFWSKKQRDLVASISQFPEMFGLSAASSVEDREAYARTQFLETERGLILQALDKVWKEHLHNMDYLRQGIRLRQYGQRDPVNEYKAEAFAMFRVMLDDFRVDVAQTLLGISVITAETLQELAERRVFEDMQELRHDPNAPLPDMVGDGNVVGFNEGRQAMPQAPLRRVKVDPADPSTWHATQRNAPCPCGSGKKYKHCHGALTANGTTA